MKHSRGKNVKSKTKSFPSKSKIIIYLNFAFAGANFVFAGTNSIVSYESDAWEELIVGIVLLCMVPISMLDSRTEMNGTGYAVAVVIMHFALCVLLSFLHSFIWLAVCAIEILACVIITTFSKK